MKKEDLKNLKIGDVVSVLARGRNYEKRGIVTEICIDWLDKGLIYLSPLECEFEFGKEHTLTKKEIKTNTYAYKHSALKIDNKESKKLVIPKPVLQIYRFNVRTWFNYHTVISVISDNEVDAREAVHANIIKFSAEEDNNIRLKDVLPIISGTII